MPIITPDGYSFTYDGKENLEVFIKPAVSAPEITSLFQVRQGLRSGTYLNLVGSLSGNLEGDPGCQDFTQVGSGVSASDRQLDLCYWSYRIQECWDNFIGYPLENLLSESAADIADLDNAQLGAIMRQLAADGFRRDLFDKLSFADTGEGDPCDGLWSRLTDGVEDYEVTALDVIASLGASDIKANFKNLYESASNLLKQVPMAERRFYVTQNVYEALMEYYEDGARSGGFVLREEDGVVSLRYRGILVEPIIRWDEYISANSLSNNARILYTTPRNHVLGVGRSTDQDNLRIWYDPNTDYWRVRGRMNWGYNYIHGDYQIFSWGDV